MLKRLQGFIIGVMACLLLGGTVLAAELIVNPNPFPVLINGTAAEVEGYNINGFTYLKLADFKKAGLVVKFNETDKQIEITNNITMAQAPTMGVSTMSERVTQTPDGLPVDYMVGNKYDKVNGSPVISILEIRFKYKEQGYDVKSLKNNAFQLIRVNPDKEESVLLDNIVTTLQDGFGRITYDYYVNTVLPLIN